jgi:hypothetical protein
MLYDMSSSSDLTIWLDNTIALRETHRSDEHDEEVVWNECLSYKSSTG